MWIKICGLSTKAAVKQAVASGATHVGFVFAESKRQVTIEQAKVLATLVPKNIKKVGLFVNAPLEVVEQTVSAVGLDMVQLHGSESAAYIEKLSIPIIKAIKVVDGKLPDNLSDYKDCVILLDAPAGQFAGGNGQSFDWAALDLSQLAGYQYFVAGGLKPENVALAIETLSPTGVDVSSGVETDGVKDIVKISKFIEVVKNYVGID